MPGGFGGGGAGGMRFGRDEKFEGRILDKKILGRLWKFARPYWLMFAISLLLILAVAASSIARPYIVKIAIDDYIQKAANGEIAAETARKGVGFVSILFIALILIEFIFGYLQTYLLQATGKRIIMNVRNRIFEHIQSLPVAYFDKNPVGRLVTRVTNDTDALNEMYTDVVVSFIQDIFIMTGLIIIMLFLDVKLTLIIMATSPLMLAAAIVFRKKARKIFGVVRVKLASINAFMSEHISGMKIIQAFNMEDKKHEEFNEINREYLAANNHMISVFGILRPFMDVVNSLALSLLLWIGGKGILAGNIEVGTLFAFITYIGRFFQPIMDITEKYNTLQSSLVSSDRIFNLLDEKPERYNEASDKEIKVKGRIEFKNVWFAYIGENWVLKDISFIIEPGQSAAFVGATGAGKTSIINLICGFYENQKGQILIDGMDIKNINKKALRSNIGLVLQDVFLFSGDIKTNISLFDNEISDERIVEASKYVNADIFIKRMDNGYKSIVNEKGSTLSSGERQLLSFARALVRDPAILVMDEATSNIDTQTEQLIQEALQKLMEGRTTIAIAHRLSTIQKADRIIVIHRGRIAEKGNHRELLEKEGLYYNLYRLQYNGEEVV